jgi:hypothetical protein
MMQIFIVVFFGESLEVSFASIAAVFATLLE